MSFILQPGTIPHIQHMYQPTKDWDIGSGLAVELLNMINTSVQTKQTAWQLGISHKIDDKVSMKVAKIHGEYFVGYKGLNSPFLDSIGQIDFLYNDKQYIREPMSALLHHAKDIIPEDDDNVEVQVGILWHSYLAGVTPYKVKPNVVEYSLRNIPTTTQLIISVVSATRFNESGVYFDRDLSSFTKGSKKVFVLNPKVQYARSRTNSDCSHGIEAVSQLRERMLENKSFDVIRGYEEILATFMNWRNRQVCEGVFPGMTVAEFLDWYKNHYIIKNVMKLKKEINQKKRFVEFQAKVTYIEENIEHFKEAFSLSKMLLNVSDLVREVVEGASLTNFTFSNPSEGIVVTYPYDKTGLIIFKIVPAEFSIENFEKNKDLYK